MAIDNLAGVLERINKHIEGDEVSVDDLIAAFQDRGFGALLIIFGLVAAMPLVGAIPGVSIITGSLILLIAMQFLAGLRHPWIPKALRNRTISKSTVETGVQKSLPYAEWFDSCLSPRIEWIVSSGVGQKAIALVCCFLALTMFPLALVPWGVFPPALAVMIFGVAILAKDGLLALFGYGLGASTLYVLYISWGLISSLT